MLKSFVLFIAVSLIYSSDKIIDSEYLDMLERSLIKLNEAYVDSVDSDELIK